MVDINKKGQVMVYRLMIVVFVILLALVLITPLKDVIVDTRDTDKLNCTSPDLTYGQESACLGVDLLLPYFIGAIVIFGFIYYFSRKRQEVV
jgi:hypothetical protein